ncbi:dihydrolipoamide dehydrogenase [Candidatus Riesia sp. GBBU]|nr:dihydrolipoamide dehydrogenase [Candidatus Riesia sp. GBBU]
MNYEVKTEVIVLGSGPAGYTAAFRCADLGLKTTLVERDKKIGGTCLNYGCIPSKLFLYVSNIIEETNFFYKKGIVSRKLSVNSERIKIWKNKVVNKMEKNLSCMAKIRKIKTIYGEGKFIDSNNILVKQDKNSIYVNFKYAIIAVGSKSNMITNFPKSNRIWNSREALEIKEVPKHMLIIGGGIIGLEIATIYFSLGSKIDIVESTNQIIPSVEKSTSEFYKKIIEKKFNLMIEKKIKSVEIKDEKVIALIEDKKKFIKSYEYDVILVAIGRSPNSKLIDAQNAGIKLDENGFVITNNQMRTNISNIYAIGDVVGNPMLAHKGIHEGKIAAEVISGMRHYFDPKIIPSIAYTKPEIAWVGLTEIEAEKQGIEFKSSIFPWSASGKAIVSNSEKGFTKILFDRKTKRIIGGTVVGSNGGELIGEICLAIEMGCTSEDISLTIHSHPTLHESISIASEIFLGTATDLINKRNKRNFYI